MDVDVDVVVVFGQSRATRRSLYVDFWDGVRDSCRVRAVVSPIMPALGPRVSLVFLFVRGGRTRLL